MSNDLISRSEVIKLIDEFGYVNCHNGKDFEANSRVDKIRQKVVEMPTAYDVDKVVEQLDELGCKGCEYADDFERCHQDCECKEISESAIEIVKTEIKG